MTNFASKDLTAGPLNSLVKHLGGHKRVLRILFGELKKLLSTGTTPFLTVLPDLAFEDRITRGHYDWRNNNLIEKRFPVTAEQVGDWEWKLFDFNRNISCDKAIRLIPEEGFEPGQIGHLLTFGEINPEEQRKGPIIALGSVAEVHLNQYVSVLFGNGGSRSLDLGWFDGVWSDHCRFLGVRRRSAA